jgi:ribonuclease BN (tRNA processing enzyme)
VSATDEAAPALDAVVAVAAEALVEEAVRAADGLRVTVVGCSGSYPGPGSACSGYLVQAGGTSIAVDLGTGSLANLQAHLPLDGLDAVVLSHSHPDHWVDLAGLEVALKYRYGRRELPVYGNALTATKAEVLLDGLEPTFAWHEVGDGDRVTIGELDVGFAATSHYVPTLAMSMAAGGRVLAYSADTGPDWSFGHLGVAIHLALCEATHLQDGEGDGVLHLSARQAGALARQAGVERLVLTHLAPGTDPDAARREAEPAFGGPVTLAAIHDRYVV